MTYASKAVLPLEVSVALLILLSFGVNISCVF